MPAGQRVLVTCSRNVAVESIAQKLERCTPDGLIVFGNASRIGETARKYLLDEENAGVIRTHNHMRSLFKLAGLKMERSEVQQNFPKDLHPVRMYWLLPNDE